MESGGVFGIISTSAGQLLTGSIERTYSTGAIPAQEIGGSSNGLSGGFGGFVGMDGGSTLSISKAYSAGTIQNLGVDSSNISGFIAWVGGPVAISDVYTTTNVLSSELALSSSGLLNAVGGAATLARAHAYQTQLTNGNAQYGLVSGVTPVNSWFYDGSLGTANASNVAQNAAWFTNQTNFTGWDFTNVWELTNGTYPTLRNMPTP